MSNTFKASRDIIIRTEKWSEALKFYGSVLGLPITERSETIVGFETGAFCLYVERGKEHGPGFSRQRMIKPAWPPKQKVTPHTVRACCQRGKGRDD